VGFFASFFASAQAAVPARRFARMQSGKALAAGLRGVLQIVTVHRDLLHRRLKKQPGTASQEEKLC
jgi:hypothetical protein